MWYTSGFDNVVDEVLDRLDWLGFLEDESGLDRAHRRRRRSISPEQRRVRAEAQRARNPLSREARREADRRRRAEMARRLKTEHPHLHPDVVSAALRGAASVAGQGGEGGDVRLTDGRLREVSVHRGSLSNLHKHIGEESVQAGPRGEIYLQVNTSATPMQIKEELQGLAVESPRRAGQLLTVFDRLGRIIHRQTIPVRGHGFDYGALDDAVDDALVDFSEDIDLAGALQNAWYYWDAWHKPSYRNFIYRGRQGPEFLATMSASQRGTDFAEKWRRQTWEGHLYILRYVWNGQRWTRDRCHIWDARCNAWTGC